MSSLTTATSSSTTSSSTQLSPITHVQPKQAQTASNIPPKKDRNICLSILYGTIGAICVVAAVVFALMAALMLGAAIFAAASGGGPTGLIVGGIGAAVFAGLAISGVIISIYYFRKI